MTRVLLMTLALSLALICPLPLTARNISAPVKRQQPNPAPANCESNSSTLAGTHQAALATGADTLIIVIARLGDGERRRELNHRRLHNVRVFLTEFWKRAPETVVTAEGERVKGYGRVELYVGGRLFDIIAIKTRGDLLVSMTCEPDNIRPKWADRNLYPYRDRKARR